jgi:hypothetical protein
MYVRNDFMLYINRFLSKKSTDCILLILLTPNVDVKSNLLFLRIFGGHLIALVAHDLCMTKRPVALFPITFLLSSSFISGSSRSRLILDTLLRAFRIQWTMLRCLS